MVGLLCADELTCASVVQFNLDFRAQWTEVREVCLFAVVGNGELKLVVATEMNLRLILMGALREVFFYGARLGFVTTSFHPFLVFTSWPVLLIARSTDQSSPTFY